MTEKDSKRESTSKKATDNERPTKVLVVTSHGTPAGAAAPVVAAMLAAGCGVSAMDVGRVGARYRGTVERVMKAISAEFAERRLARAISSNKPDVALAFDPGSVSAILELRRHSPTDVAVVAVVAELDPDPAWAEVKADRFLTIDSEAAVSLADSGVRGEQIMTIGPITGFPFAAAGKQKREVVRARFGLPLSESVVLAAVEGLGPEMTTQLALQLALLDRPVTYLFAAGSDADSANALRRQVPTLDLRAKLFGKTNDAPLLWRASDAVIASPTAEIAQRVLVLNTKMIALAASDDEGGRIAAALEDRGMGGAAANALMVSGALELMLATGHSASSSTGTDGAANVADVVIVVGRDKSGVVKETRFGGARGDVGSSPNGASGRADKGAPSGLEDLSGGVLEDLFGSESKSDDKTRKLAALRAKLEQLGKTVGSAQEAAEQWEAKEAEASRAKDHARAKQAATKAKSERASMHRSLKEMSAIEGQLRKLEGRDRSKQQGGASSGRARSSGGGRRSSGSAADDMLNDMKRREARTKATVDDELEALKRKMTNKRGK